MDGEVFLMPLRKRVAAIRVWVAASGVVALIFLLIFFLGGAFMYFGWNYGVVPVFAVPRLPYLPACFICLLVRLVFGVGGKS